MGLSTIEQQYVRASRVFERPALQHDLLKETEGRRDLVGPNVSHQTDSCSISRPAECEGNGRRY
jgi:hypothetical protein